MKSNFTVTADYHTHTKYSDGKGTVRENVEAAVAKGLETVVISDHGFNQWKSGIKRKDVAKMRKEIEELKKEFPQIQILLGVEANLVSLRGDLDLTDEEVKLFDFIICGVHYTGTGVKFSDNFTFMLRNYFPGGKGRKEKITQAYIEAMKRYPIRVLAHLKYVVDVDVAKIAQEAAKHDVWIELNGKRVFFNDEDIQAIKDAGAKLVINSDAHTPQRVGEMPAVERFAKIHEIPWEIVVNIKKD